MKITEATLDRVFEIHQLVEELEGLVHHPVHFYNIMIRYFGNSFFIAKENDKIIGFVWGFVSQTDPQVCFLWQIGVSANFRGKGISGKLLGSFIHFAAEKGCKLVRATVEPGNIASWKLFERHGFEVSSTGKTITENKKLAVVNYYGSGTNQVVYEKEVT